MKLTGLTALYKIEVFCLTNWEKIMELFLLIGIGVGLLLTILGILATIN